MSNSLQQVCCGPLQNSANRNQCPDYRELRAGSPLQVVTVLAAVTGISAQCPVSVLGAATHNNHYRKPTLRSTSYNCSWAAKRFSHLCIKNMLIVYRHINRRRQENKRLYIKTYVSTIYNFTHISTLYIYARYSGNKYHAWFILNRKANKEIIWQQNNNYMQI